MNRLPLRSPGERAAWEKLRDEFLPAYREAVDACEDGPIVLEMAEVERRLLGHARGNAYYEYIWRLRTKEKLFIYAIEALGDIQRDGTQEGLRSDVVAVERIGPDGESRQNRIRSIIIGIVIVTVREVFMDGHVNAACRAVIFSGSAGADGRNRGAAFESCRA